MVSEVVNRGDEAIVRIGVLADTHIPDRTDELPAEIFDIFQGVALILHAGDICQQAVLNRIQAVAPVYAVRGNREWPDVRQLPEKRVIAVGEWRIGLIHGMRSRRQENADRLRYLGGDHRFLDLRRYVCQAFAADTVHCIIFGHTHQVCREWQDGVLLFNPGGVVRSIGGEPSSVGILELGARGIAAHVIPLRNPPRRLTLAEQLQRSFHRERTQE